MSLPEGWATTTLGAIAHIVGGITKGQKRRGQAQLRSVPYLRVANVQRAHLNLSEIKTIDATEEEIEELRLRPDDILFTEGGDRDKLGRGWVWSGEISECIHQNHVFRARVRAPGVESKYVSWFANLHGKDYFMGEASQTVNLASISITKLRGLPLSLPPSGEQRRIVAKVEALLSRVNAARDKLEVVARSLGLHVEQGSGSLAPTIAAILSKAFRGELVPTDAELAREAGRPFESAEELLRRIDDAARVALPEAARGKKQRRRGRKSVAA